MLLSIISPFISKKFETYSVYVVRLWMCFMAHYSVSRSSGWVNCGSSNYLKIVMFCALVIESSTSLLCFFTSSSKD